MWARFSSALDGRRWLAPALALAASVPLAFVDYQGGPNVQFPLLYLLPIAFAAWHAGAGRGLALAFVLTGVGTALALYAWESPQSRDEVWLNAGIRALVFGFVAVLVARTARHQRRIDRAEAALRGESSYLALAQEAAEAGAFSRDLRSGEGSWSPEYYRLLGLDPATDPPSLDSFLRVLHPDDRAAFPEKRRAAIERRGRLATEVRVIGVGGEIRWLRLRGRVLVGADGRPERLVGVAINVTEQKVAERAQSESDSRFRSLFMNMSAGYAHCRVLFDDGAPKDAVLLEVNPAFEKLLRVQDVAGRTLRRVLPGLAGPDGETLGRLARVARWGVPDHFEAFLPALDEWLAVSAYCPSRDHFVAIFDVITERKRSEEQLRANRDELAAANEQLLAAARMKDEFFSRMSHELRTPLHAALSLAGSLLDESLGPLLPAQKDALATVESSGRHLLSMLNDLLDYTRIEAGRLPLHVDTVSVADLCEGSLAAVRSAARAKGIDLGLDGPGPEATVEGDPRRLKQMLVHLLGNAVKFTPDGGRVRLGVAADAAEGVLRFEVEDTGIGIASEKLERLFEPLTQLDSGLNRSYGGTGLGLALTQRLAALHGGTVRVESTPGVGSRFTLAVPCRAGAAAS